MRARDAQRKVCPLMSNQDFKVKCISFGCILWKWEDYKYVKPEFGDENQIMNCEGFCNLGRRSDHVINK